MPSGLPSLREGEKEKPSEHVFDGFSHAIESIFFHVFNLLVKTFCIDKSYLRNDGGCLAASHLPNGNIVRITLSSSCKRDHKANRTTKSLENQHRPSSLRA